MKSGPVRVGKICILGTTSDFNICLAHWIIKLKQKTRNKIMGKKTVHVEKLWALNFVSRAF